MIFEPFFASLGPLGSAAVLVLMLSVPSALAALDVVHAGQRRQAR